MRPFLIIVSVLLLVQSACAQVSDAEIRTELQRRIARGTGVNIAVQNGVVTLSGTVSSLATELSALNMARRTVGVRSVTDRITVAPAQRRSDADIERSVRDVLSGNLGKEEIAAVNIRVQNGMVTLTGTLTSSYPKQLATTLISFVPGVAGIQNNITVRPAQVRSDAEILADVRTRYARNPLVPQDQINVAVENGVVTLTGTVDSFLQSEQAESIARFTPGVVDVRNNLFVRAGG